MANKRIRTSPRYLEFSSVVGGNLYTVTGDGIVVDETIATTLAATATTAGIGTVVADTTSPTSPLQAPITRFTNPQTATPYVIPSWATSLLIRVCGSGGGGASGGRFAAGQTRSGGGAGGGGGFSELRLNVPDLGAVSQLLVTVASGGAGGAGVNVDTTAGVDGNNGSGLTLVATPGGVTLVAAAPGQQGKGPTVATPGAATGGGIGNGLYAGSAGGAGGGLNGGTGAATISGGATGGGGGGGANNLDAPGSGGPLSLRAQRFIGASSSTFYPVGVGAAAGVDGQDAPLPLGLEPGGGAGGGGGSNGVRCGKGGNGVYGSGGGGGGTATNGTGVASGAGGKGGDGFVEIIASATPF